MGPRIGRPPIIVCLTFYLRGYEMSKYDNLAWNLFKKSFADLTRDEQIDIEDIYYEREE